MEKKTNDELRKLFKKSNSLKITGNCVNNGHVIPLSQDLHVRVTISPHSLFTRNGNDLYTKKTLTLKEALCGAQFSFILS